MSSRIVDNLIAYRILYMLVQPFVDTKAYKLGIIDKDGKNLRKATSLDTEEERDSYSYLHRLVFNLKKIINKLPGGESKIKSLIAALWLVKEYYEKNDRSTSLMEERYMRILEKVNSGVTLVEEEIAVNKFLNEEGEGAAPANVTGAAVSTDQPKIGKKEIEKYKKFISRRKAPLNVGTKSPA